MSTVFIALQTNEDTRQIIEAIEIDNPHAIVHRRDFDLQEMHINLISLSGNVVEDDDTLTLSWNS